MPGVPAFTIAEATHTYHPVDTFVLRSHGQPSILDTVFISKRSRRAVYATTTHGSRTSLWRVAASGAMTEIARIDWEYEVKVTSAGDGSLRNVNKPSKKCPMLTFGGKMVRTEEFLQKGRGWFSGDSSRVFCVKDAEYKWKSGTENIGTSDGLYARNQNSAYHEVWKIWRCVAPRSNKSLPSPTTLRIPFSPINTSVLDPARQVEATPAGPSFSFSDPFRDHNCEPQSPASTIRSVISPILNAPAAPTVLARFAPPQMGLIQNEISFFPAVFPPASDPNQNPYLLECVLVSAVLLAACKGEWKHIQSASHPSALQAVFTAEAVGEIPPYTPSVHGTLGRASPIAVQYRTISGGSRGRNVFPETGLHVITTQPADGSERTPLLTRRNTHQASRSNPLNVFPTPHFNIRTRSRANSARSSDSRQPAHGSLAVRRPATADSTPAGDGIFSRRRPSTQGANSARTDAAGRRPSTAGGVIHSPPMSCPPPAYA